MRKRSDGTREGLITARVPLAIARETKMLAIEQDRAVRYVVADALRAYIAGVDAANAKQRTAPAEAAAE